MARALLAAAVLAAFALTGCSVTTLAGSGSPAAPAQGGTRVMQEDQMSAYIASATALYRSDPTYGAIYENPSESALHNFEVSGRAMCEVMIAGVTPDRAYAAAYPRVAEAGNVGELERLHGHVAADFLCPVAS